MYLDISADQYLRYYSGSAKSVMAKTTDGLTIRFPANVLQKYLLKDGIKGVFRIVYDEHHRLVSFDRVGEVGQVD